MSNDTEIEKMIQEKGCTAPRVTPEDIESNIIAEHYFTPCDALIDGNTVVGLKDRGCIDAVTKSLSVLTFCVLVLQNGFTVTGESACASPENFNPKIGKKIARQNAVNKMWSLMGYHLKQQLHEAALVDQSGSQAFGDIVKHLGNAS